MGSGFRVKGSRFGGVGFDSGFYVLGSEPGTSNLPNRTLNR